MQLIVETRLIKIACRNFILQ